MAACCWEAAQEAATHSRAHPFTAFPCLVSSPITGQFWGWLQARALRRAELKNCRAAASLEQKGKTVGKEEGTQPRGEAWHKVCVHVYIIPVI